MDKHKATALAHIHFLQPQLIDTNNDSVTLSNRARARLLRNQGSSRTGDCQYYEPER